MSLNDFSIVIGTGFNQWLFGSEKSFLTSWWDLLFHTSEAIGFKDFENIKNRGNSSTIFIWESMIFYHLKNTKQKDPSCKNSKNWSMSDAENDLLLLMANMIEKETDRIIQNKDIIDRFNLFFDRFYSGDRLDIISLNFDLIFEKLLKLKVDKVNEKISWYESKTTKTLSRAHAKVCPATHFVYDKCYIWHPHGHVKHHKSMIVGLHRYINSASNVIESFNFFRGFESQYRKNNYNNINHRFHRDLNDLNPSTTWVGASINTSLLLIGVGLSKEEIDIWEYIHLRIRNHANIENNKPVMIRFSSNQEPQDLHQHWHNLSYLLHINNKSFGSTWDEAWHVLLHGNIESIIGCS